MTLEEVRELKLGLYKMWFYSDPPFTNPDKPDDPYFDKYCVVAAVGCDMVGQHWFAATNWINVPWFDWKKVRRVELIMTQEQANEKNHYDDVQRLAGG